MQDEFMFHLHMREAITYLNDAKEYLGEGGEKMNMVEIMELLKNILEVLDKLYHATIGEEEETNDKVY